jgi:LysM repeat protein
MADPLKNPASPGDNAPRTARARSERDLGTRSKRTPRGQRAKRSESRAESTTDSQPASKSKNGARSASRAEPRPTNGGGGKRPSRGAARPPQRPRDVKAGGGARLLAPVALVIFAIACFTVLSNQDSGSKAKSSDNAAATKAAATTAAAKSGPTRSTYRVKPGDSFAAIAEKQGVDVQTLQALNPKIDPRELQPGQKLKLK